MIQRQLQSILQEKLHKGKAIILIGARQTGKTTLLKELIKDQDRALWLNADDMDVRNIVQSLTISRLPSLVKQYECIVIDEAQRIENIGLQLKLITDNMPNIQLLVTGSSALELANTINEPLTGRKYEYPLYPLSFFELQEHFGLIQEQTALPVRLVYGSYPDVVCHPGEEKEILSQLADGYLYKDVLQWERIKKPEKLLKLLQALAYQMGSEVNYTELAQIVGLDKETIGNYITLLEQAKVVFRLSSFSRNLRNELKHARKIYFYDNGIRNALINNYADVSTRQDIGALWENYLVSERLKNNQYSSRYVNSYFWRTTQMQEIDYLEEYDGKLYAYEFKWNVNKKVKSNPTFNKAYPGVQIVTVTPLNYMDFLDAISF
ncbi:MAG: ATP-binding protein [Bacteroidales bacterium]|nr:ATP-binding protein [Bacteroidales bacterium]